LVTLYYLRKYPVTVPLSIEDDELTILSLQKAQREISENKNPSRVMPSRYGFPCDWCIGYETCGKIKDAFRVDGRFRLPTISCAFHSPSEPCWGNIYPVKDQVVDENNVADMIYACKGHTEANSGGEYTPNPDDSSEAN
jgi:hypothetical protein